MFLYFLKDMVSCATHLVGLLFLGAAVSFSTACTKKREAPQEEVLTMDMEDASGGRALDPTANKGIGPIKKVELGPLNLTQAKRGKEVFDSKCLACHQFDKRMVGPPLSGVTKRRSPEWIMNMIINTNEMVEKDPIVKSMIAEYMTKMTYQDVSKENARALLEYFRQKDGVK